jgi:hypothetical protein
LEVWVRRKCKWMKTHIKMMIRHTKSISEKRL